MSPTTPTIVRQAAFGIGTDADALADRVADPLKEPLDERAVDDDRRQRGRACPVVNTRPAMTGTSSARK